MTAGGRELRRWQAWGAVGDATAWICFNMSAQLDNSGRACCIGNRIHVPETFAAKQIFSSSECKFILYICFARSAAHLRGSRFQEAREHRSCRVSLSCKSWPMHLRPVHEGPSAPYMRDLQGIAVLPFMCLIQGGHALLQDQLDS